MLKPPQESVQHIEHVESLICQAKRGRYYITGSVTLAGDDQGPIDLYREVYTMRCRLDDIAEDLNDLLDTQALILENQLRMMQTLGIIPTPAAPLSASASLTEGTIGHG